MEGDSLRVQAVGSSFVRTLLVLPFWIARLATQGPWAGSITVWTLLFDLLLVAGHGWAIAPVARYQGRLFPNGRQLSTNFVFPFLIALFFAARDFYYAFTGRLP